MKLRNKHKDLVLSVTNRCDLHCPHCIRGGSTPDDIPLNLLNKVLKQSKRFNFNYLRITGGEPHLHPQFDKVIESVLRHGFRYNFITNGQNYIKYADLIVNSGNALDRVAVSLDDITNKSGDLVRADSMPGKAMDAIRFFRLLGKDTVVSTLLCERNLEQVKDLLSFCSLIGVSEVWLGGLLPGGSREGDIDISRRDKVVKHIYKIANQLGIKVFFAVTFVPMKKSGHCMNVKRPQFHILPTGEVSFCCNFVGKGVVVGNLKDKSFPELYQLVSEQAAKVFREKHNMMKNKTPKLQGWGTITDCDFCHSLLSNQIKSY